VSCTESLFASLRLRRSAESLFFASSLACTFGAYEGEASVAFSQRDRRSLNTRARDKTQLFSSSPSENEGVLSREIPSTWVPLPFIALRSGDPQLTSRTETYGARGPQLCKQVYSESVTFIRLRIAEGEGLLRCTSLAEGE
jgi:hypothetical protein